MTQLVAIQFAVSIEIESFHDRFELSLQLIVLESFFLALVATVFLHSGLFCFIQKAIMVFVIFGEQRSFARFRFMVLFIGGKGVLRCFGPGRSGVASDNTLKPGAGEVRPIRAVTVITE